MGLNLEQLRARPEPSTAEVDEFISSNSFPIVSEEGVTFVFRGEASEVHLRHWVYGLPTVQGLSRLPDTDIWYLELELPENSRIEYKFEVIRDGDSHWIVDPLNPLVAEDPFGANSVCRAYGYERPDWTMSDEEAATGRLDRLSIESAALGGRRTLRVYRPARFRRTRRYPLLIVHDGEDFLRFADLQTVLDNLIHRLEIPGMIVALSSPGDRLHEYTGDPQHARFLVEELCPALVRRYPLLDSPAARGLMGASLGAVASLHAAWSHPGHFGNLLLQSGSFAFTDIGFHDHGPVFDRVVAFVNEFRADPKQPAERLFVSCGRYESLIYENRSLVPLLQEHGLQVRYEEVPDGHNWENWRDRLQAGLTWLFPGPLWMVYE